MKKIVLIIISIIAISSTNVSAQPYKSGIGVRFGNWNNVGGLTFKKFIAPTRAFEIMAHFPYHGFVVTGLYQYQKAIGIADGVTGYAGFGGHVGSWDRYYYSKSQYPENKNVVVLGVDGVLGLEYTFIKAPFVIGLDWKPSFNFGDYNDYAASGLSLSLRYTF